jgi:hypothetical protein
MVDRISIWLTGYQYGWPDINMADRISTWLPGYQYGWPDINVFDRISTWLTGYQYGWPDINMVDRVSIWLTGYQHGWPDINVDLVAFTFIFVKSKSLESSLFWDVTQRRMGSWLRTFRRSNLLGSFSMVKQSKNSSWTASYFEIGPLGCLATSVTNYQSMPSKIPEEWISWTAWPLKMGPICRLETLVD